MSQQKKPSVYQRIVAADVRGRGLRLSASEVQRLANDDAIRQVAEAHDEGGDWVSAGFGTNDVVFVAYASELGQTEEG